MVNRRQFTPQFKAQVVLEQLSGAKSGAEACCQYSPNGQVLSRWKAELLQNAARAFNTGEQNSKDQARVAELERLLGRLTLELDIGKNLQHVEWQSGQKREVVMKLAEEYPVELLCQTMDYPRSSYYCGRKVPEDQGLQQQIEQLAENGPPTLPGKDRIAAQRQREGRTINHQRVHGLMGQLRLQGKVCARKRAYYQQSAPLPTLSQSGARAASCTA